MVEIDGGYVRCGWLEYSQLVSRQTSEYLNVMQIHFISLFSREFINSGRASTSERSPFSALYYSNERCLNTYSTPLYTTSYVGEKLCSDILFAVWYMYFWCDNIVPKSRTSMLHKMKSLLIIFGIYTNEFDWFLSGNVNWANHLRN